MATLLVAAGVLVLLVLTNLPSRRRSTTFNDADHSGVVVYWRPGCPYCMRLRTALRFSRLRYSEIDIRKDPEAAAFVRSVAEGNETVPTVAVAGHAMVNPTKRRVLEAVRTHTPDLGG